MDQKTARELWDALPESFRETLKSIVLEELGRPAPEPVTEVTRKPPAAPLHLETYLQNISKAMKEQNGILKAQTQALQNIAKKVR